ncbi:DUF3566 domain-containing protein [Skermania sp. ID1734]|uniref:DUF3566 domain-containing protein n=1 Tax=Skermania sp. ID1734 TaxID=2597516 RepID=UPI0011806B09|nr:DUF3566 domain-containing protein [Skermania sp. ID1734]
MFEPARPASQDRGPQGAPKQPPAQPDVKTPGGTPPPAAPPTRPQHPPANSHRLPRISETGPRPAAGATTEPPTAGQPAAQNGQPKPPQPGQQSGPQREPQSNLHRPGQPPVAGKPVASGPAPQSAGQDQKTVRQQAAKAKAAVIDGPTRSIARPELTKDMPDLSEVRHPLPKAQPGSPTSTRTAAIAAPQTVAAGEPLRATIQVRRIDPWSTLKVSFVISVALFFVWMVAVGLLYVVLDGMGVWDRLNNAFTDIVSESSSGGLISAGQVFGYATVIGLINVVLFTALATIGSFIYNQCSDLVGGIEVTLADRD